MPWNVIHNPRAARRGDADSVTVSWRPRGGSTPHAPMPMRLCVHIGAQIAASMGWVATKGEPLGKFRVEYDPETNRLRMALAKAVTTNPREHKIGFSPATNGGKIGVNVPLDHLKDDRENRPIEPVAMERAAPWLILSLPEWARHKGMDAARKAKAEALARMAA